MSQNPEHTPRRALSPPAVTRFQLRTASATEAVFSPPYVPATRDPSRPAPPPAEQLTSEPSPETSARPPALPPRPGSRELPRPAPPTRALELPPRRESEPARPETDRTEPGTWREIIARFERELGPVTDFEDDAQTEATQETKAPEAAPQPQTPGKWRAPFDIDEAEAHEPSGPDASATREPSGTAEADHPVVPAAPVDGQEAGAGAVPSSESPRDIGLPPSVEPAQAESPSGAHTEPRAGAEPVQPTGTEPVHPEPPTRAEPVQPTQPVQPGEPPTGAEPVQPGEPPLLDEPVPWEIGAMTTPDYSPPPSIHDAEHDSWPVDTEDGEAVPAWSEDVDDTADGRDADVFDEIGELLLDQVAPADPWDLEPQEAEPTPRSEFPLDAFIVPAGVQNVSGYRDTDVAQRVAHRLDELARQLRDGGFSSLGSTATVDELSRVLAAVVTGYVARGG